MAESAPHWPQPSHPDLISVEKGLKPFTTRAVILKDLPAGAVVADMSAATFVNERRYTTVQASKDSDIELNSDLVYCNHSCDPNLVFDMKKMEVRAIKELKKGDDITFFYPSSEFDMSQPFECTCGAGSGVCVGTVKGARYLEPNVLEKYWLNRHIVELLAEPKTNGSS